MSLAAEHPPTVSSVHGTDPRPLYLRVHGGAKDESLITLGAGKNSIGSGPRCTVRLAEAGVQPLHCLIVNEAHAVRLRPWAHDTLLNGIESSDANLTPGDRISLGTIELEVVGEEIENIAVADREFGIDKPAEAATEIESTAVGKETSRPSTTTETDCSPVGTRDTSAHARERSRKLVHALRDHRVKYDELLTRISNLERRIDAMLYDQATSASRVSSDSPLDDDATPLESADEAVYEPNFERNSADDWLVSARAALSRDRAPWMESQQAAAEEIVEPTELDQFDEEVVALQGQLADGERQSSELRAQIENLEHQLDDSRRMLQHFAAERTEWQTQLANTESRLGAYIERIQELSGLLDEARNGRENSPAAPASSLQAENDDQLPSPQVEHVDENHNSDEADPKATPTEAPDDTESVALETTRIASGDAERDKQQFGEQGTLQEAAGIAAVASEADYVSEDSHPGGDQESLRDREQDEVDTALAHLRDLSVWRQELVDERELSAAGHEKHGDPSLENVASVGEDTDTSSGAFESVPTSADAPKQSPASFIERYSHLLDEAESDEPSASVSADSTSTSSTRRDTNEMDDDRASSLDATSTTAGSPATHDDDESMEQYMAQMMDRIRGNLFNIAAAEANQSRTVETRYGDRTAAPAAPVVAPTPPEAPEAPPRPRAPAAELSTDMNLLRALANQSARQAISVHAARTLRRTALRRFIIALLAGIAALYFLLISPGWGSLQFATACVAALAALYWGRQTFQSLIEAVQLGAFEKSYDNFVAVDDSKPAMPIDVPQSPRGPSP